MLRSNLNTINARIFNKTAIRIDDQALREVEACYRFLEKFEQGKVIYGINTGFGPMAQYRIGDADLNSLQYNIIRSHSCGAGETLPDICVRAAMLARLQTFLNAKSGVHPDVVRILADFLNNEIYPLVPRHGSVGASGVATAPKSWPKAKSRKATRSCWKSCHVRACGWMWKSDRRTMPAHSLIATAVDLFSVSPIDLLGAEDYQLPK